MSTPPKGPSGFLATLRAAANGGALAGLFLGLADGLVAAVRVPEPPSAGRLVLCLAASVLVYGLAHGALQLALAPLAHPLLRRRRVGERYRILFGVALGVGLFLELYWWTRPFVFPGLRALAPERVAAAAGLAALGLALGWGLALLWARLRRLHGIARVALPLLWLAGGAFLVFERGAFERSGRGLVNARTRELPNVLLVVVDALRQDTLGPYGDERVRTPAIDRLAREGVLFENAFVQAPFTWSSFGSFLTGKHPRRHGLVKMASGVALSDNVTLPLHLKSARFAEGSPQRAAGHERLAPKDYVGAAFLTGTLTHGSGLDRGFDLYSEALVGHELTSRDGAWSPFRSELLLFLVKNKLTQRVDYNLAGTTAAAWLGEHGRRRFVALVHLYSTHTPYDPAPQFRALYCDPSYDGPIQRFTAYERDAIEKGKYPATDAERARFPADLAQIQNLYYGGVSQADAAIGDVLAALERAGVLDDTLVVLTSDHGEDLGEGGRFEHNHMVPTNLRIPLVVRYPRALPRGKRIAARVDSIDVLPSVCALVGVDPPERVAEQGERGRIDGTSLLPLVRGEVDAVRPYSFAENGRYLSIHDGAHLLVVAHRVLPEAGWRRMLAGERGYPRPQLFDVADDPLGEHDAFAPDHPELERLLAALRAHDAAMPIPLSAVVESHRDRELDGLLDDLGYAGGVGLGLEER